MDLNLDKEIQRLKTVITQLEKTVEFLRRENTRRKNEISSIITAIRKG